MKQLAATALFSILLTLILTACGGPTTPEPPQGGSGQAAAVPVNEPGYGGPVITQDDMRAVEVPGNRRPRTPVTSAEQLEVGEGTDICGLFPGVGTLPSPISMDAIPLTYPSPPPQVIDPTRDYAAWIVTEEGTAAVNLFADLAPVTVNNLAFLACNGFYDGITWHRVIPDFVAQTGDPSGTGAGGPGYTIIDEYPNSDLTFDRAGLLSMAKTNAPDSARSQFYITYAPTPNLNGAFTVFGYVVDGMDAIQALAPRDPQADPNAPPGSILETVIVRQVP
jgi:peptidylprolyl isomerase